MMDASKKNKKKPMLLKLNVDVPDVAPESTHSNKKAQSDLFFQEYPDVQVYILNSDEQYAQFTYEGKLVADVAQMKGGRKQQEDKVLLLNIQFVAIPNLEIGVGFQFYYGVFDGHGGPAVSKILSQELHKQLVEDAHFCQDLQNAIMSSFEKMNRQILDLQDRSQLDGGSTALCVINQGQTLYVINVGDSTCVLVKDDFTIAKMNEEHKLSREDELKRVEQLATILDRQHIPRINGEIAVTRSFGDKKHRTAGLIAEPEITTYNIKQEDKYLILASDGFWDLIQKDELSKLLKNWNGVKIEQISSYLLEAALQRNTNFKKDNMTIIVIDIKEYWKL